MGYKHIVNHPEVVRNYGVNEKLWGICAMTLRSERGCSSEQNGKSMSTSQATIGEMVGIEIQLCPDHASAMRQ